MREENKKGQKCGCHTEKRFSLLLFTKSNNTVQNTSKKNKYMMKIT